MLNPNRTLETVREMVEKFSVGGALDDQEIAALISAIDSLDTWVENGGVLPNDWRKAKGCQRPARPPMRGRR
jgi:hypothetical protein